MSDADKWPEGLAGAHAVLIRASADVVKRGAAAECPPYFSGP